MIEIVEYCYPIESEPGNVSPGYYVSVEDASTQTNEEDFISLSPTRDASTQTEEEDFVDSLHTREVGAQTTEDDFKLLSQIDDFSDEANLADFEENSSNPCILLRKRSYHFNSKRLLGSLGTSKVVQESEAYSSLREICTTSKTSVKKPAVSKIPNCSKCGKRFMKESNLKVHILSKCHPRPFKCGKCDDKFSTLLSLTRHKRVHLDDKPFRCKHCDYTAKWEQAVAIHIKRHHKKVVQESEAQSSLYEPKISPKTRVDRLSVSKIPNCAKCGKRFIKESIRIFHLLSNCDPAPYKCGQCDAKYTEKNYLVSHSLVHSDVKSFKCNHCDHAYKRKLNLDYHIKRHHENSLLVENLLITTGKKD